MLINNKKNSNGAMSIDIKKTFKWLISVTANVFTLRQIDTSGNFQILHLISDGFVCSVANIYVPYNFRLCHWGDK